MIKKAWNYIKVSLTSSPFWFIFNLIMLIVFRLAQLGTDFAMKYATGHFGFQENRQSKYKYNHTLCFIFSYDDYWRQYRKFY